MSSLKFPVIESKKQLEEEDYNFINKDKKKKSTNNPLELIEDLKYKIEQQKKQIENRNITIQGLQRNFQSLSAIVKNQKAQSAILRAELENLKNSSETGDKRAMDFHEKLVIMQNQNKALSSELKNLKKSHSECSHYVTLSQEFKRTIMELEQTNSKLHSKITTLDSNKKALETELLQFKSIDKEKRGLNQRIVDLEFELKNACDQNNLLQDQARILQENVKQAKNQQADILRRAEENKLKVKDLQKNKAKSEKQIDNLNKQINRLRDQMEEYKKMIENKNMLNDLKSLEEQNAKKDYRSLQQKYQTLQQNYTESETQRKQAKQLIEISNGQIIMLRKQLSILKEKNNEINRNNDLERAKMSEQLNNLEKGMKSLNSNLEDEKKSKFQEGESHLNSMQRMTQKIQKLERSISEMEDKYGHFIRLIDKNQPNVVITNEEQLAEIQNSSSFLMNQHQKRYNELQSNLSLLESTIEKHAQNIETMKRYISNLEAEIASKNKELLNKNAQLRKYQEEEEMLNKVIEEEHAQQEKLKQELKLQLEAQLSSIEQEKNGDLLKIRRQKQRVQEELEAERKRNQEKVAKQEENMKLLNKYQAEEESLKKILAEQQKELESKIREKQQELQKQKKANKELWQDNKKLKEYEKELAEKQKSNQDEVERLKQKYQQEIQSLKTKSNEETTTGELKKILQEKSTQMTALNENLNKVKSEVEFYKNRNKELEGVCSRLEKQYKDKNADMDKESKVNKQVVQLLDKKNKDLENSLQELQKKNKKEIKLLYEEIESEKLKRKNLKIEEKINLIQKTISDMDTSLKTLLNTLSCNYCVEVVKECVRLECGHIYCKKCKAGYEPNCGECKKKGLASPDKLIDDAVSKGEYMRILMNTVMDDLTKITLN